MAAESNHYETCGLLLRAGISKDSRTKVERYGNDSVTNEFSRNIKFHVIFPLTGHLFILLYAMDMGASSNYCLSINVMSMLEIC